MNTVSDRRVDITTSNLNLHKLNVTWYFVQMNLQTTRFCIFMKASYSYTTHVCVSRRVFCPTATAGAFSAHFAGTPNRNAADKRKRTMGCTSTKKKKQRLTSCYASKLICPHILLSSLIRQFTSYKVHECDALWV